MRKVIAMCFAVYTLIAMIVAIVAPYCVETKNTHLGWQIFGFLFMMEIVYAILSFKTIGPSEVGVVLFLERPVAKRKSGFVFVPWILCRIVTFQKAVIQQQYPDEPENVDKSGDDSGVVKNGPNGKPMAKPIRVTTASKESALKKDPNNPSLTNYDPSAKENGDDPLNVRLTIEVSVLSRMKIDDPKQFIGTIGSLEEAKRQIRDTVEVVLKAELAKRSTAQALADLEIINLGLKKEVEDLVYDRASGQALNAEWMGPNHWGIKIIDILIVDIDPSKTINSSLRDMANAEMQKRIVITQAEGAKQEVIEAAEGKAKETTLLAEAESKAIEQLANANKKRVIAEGEATAKALRVFLGSKAKGLEEIAKKLRLEDEGEVLLIAEMMEKGFDKAQHTFFFGGEGITSATGILAKVQQALVAVKEANNGPTA